MAGEIAAFGCVTHPGQVRDHNEDTVYADAVAGLFVVADGMGGHEAGEVASRVAADSVEAAFREGAALSEAVMSAHAAVIEAAQNGQGAAGMGTTLVALAIQADGQYQLAWVGDSRAYEWDGRQLRQVSTDQTVVQAMIDGGALSPERAAQHPDRSVLSQAIGMGDRAEVVPGEAAGQLAKGGVLILCSDGLTDEVDDSGISERVVADADDVEALAKALVDMANANGGSDNVSVITVAAPADAPERIPMAQTRRIDATRFQSVGGSPSQSAHSAPKRWRRAALAVLAASVLATLSIAYLSGDDPAIEGGSVSATSGVAAPTGEAAVQSRGDTEPDPPDALPQQPQVVPERDDGSAAPEGAEPGETSKNQEIEHPQGEHDAEADL